MKTYPEQSFIFIGFFLRIKTTFAFMLFGARPVLIIEVRIPLRFPGLQLIFVCWHCKVSCLVLFVFDLLQHSHEYSFAAFGHFSEILDNVFFFLSFYRDFVFVYPDKIIYRCMKSAGNPGKLCLYLAELLRIQFRTLRLGQVLRLRRMILLSFVLF